jgi:hypothetical protein
MAYVIFPKSKKFNQNYHERNPQHQTGIKKKQHLNKD